MNPQKKLTLTKQYRKHLIQLRQSQKGLAIVTGPKIKQQVEIRYGRKENTTL